MMKQDRLILSPHIELYDIVVPKNHLLRELSDLVDFSFVDDMLKDKYTLNNGRPGYAPKPEFYSCYAKITKIYNYKCQIFL